MAAETLTAARAKASFPKGGKGDAMSVKVAYGTYEIAANVEDGDIFEMCWIPAGATVIGGQLIGDDLDTGIEALDLDVGWAANGVDAADPDGFLNGGTLSGDAVGHAEVGIVLPFQGVLAGGPKTFTVDTKVQIEANTAAATGGTGTITVYVYYITP